MFQLKYNDPFYVTAEDSKSGIYGPAPCETIRYTVSKPNNELVKNGKGIGVNYIDIYPPAIKCTTVEVLNENDIPVEGVTITITRYKIMSKPFTNQS